MKLQYLGDSKDSFKWDYHDYLVDSLGYESLNVVLMMTPDDGGSHGKSKATNYPARQPVLDFCNTIRRQRDLALLTGLPSATLSSYEVNIHSEEHFPPADMRRGYFEKFSPTVDQVVLVDPDNGLEPKKSFSEKHVKFSELDQILAQTSDRSVISVFQHFRRKPFAQDFLEINERIVSGYTTAIHWHSLMFVQVTRSAKTLKNLVAINQAYASGRPVILLECN